MVRRVRVYVERGKIPTLSWKRLSFDELKKRVDMANPYTKHLLRAVKAEILQAWLDEKGEIRYQFKPEVLKGIELADNTC